MGHEQRSRGDHPEDEHLFCGPQIEKLRDALKDFCWLLTRGYAHACSLKLIGDKFQLTQRQRMLLMRSGCTDQQRQSRLDKHRSLANIAGASLFLDGFNILISIEHALAQGGVFIGQDGCYRDLASVHGTYKRVQQTSEAIRLIGATLHELQVFDTTWLLDKPVSNSGRLREVLVEIASQNRWNWQVHLCQSPDEELKKVTGTVVSTDSVILDAVDDWFHLSQQVIDRHVQSVKLIDLRDGSPALPNKTL